MKANTIVKAAKNVQRGFKKHSPEILIGLGIVGVGTTVVFAVKGTPKALRLIEEKKEELGVDSLTPIETIKVAWKPYIPALASGAATVACIIGATSVNARRQAAIATAYKLSESAFREFKDKVIENVDEDKVKEIKTAIAQDHVNSDPIEKKEIVITGVGDELCYDILSGRYFYSSVDKIQKAVNAVNDRMLKYEYVSLNDFYYELDLDNIKLGNELGWNILQGMIDVNFDATLSSNCKPCLVIDFDRMPAYNFDRLL